MSIVYSNTKVSVGSSSTTVLSATDRERRLYAILSNDSDETMYLAINEAAVLNEGIRLAAGQQFSLDTQDILNVAIYGICASGSKNLAITEIYLDAL